MNTHQTADKRAAHTRALGSACSLETFERQLGNYCFGAGNELPSLQFFDGTAHGAQRAQRGQSIFGLFTVSRVSGHAANRGRGCHEARFIFNSSTVLEADVARFCQLSNGQAECSYLYRFTHISIALRDEGATEQTLTSGNF